MHLKLSWVCGFCTVPFNSLILFWPSLLLHAASFSHRVDFNFLRIGVHSCRIRKGRRTRSSVQIHHRRGQSRPRLWGDKTTESTTWWCLNEGVDTRWNHAGGSCGDGTRGCWKRGAGFRRGKHDVSWEKVGIYLSLSYHLGFSMQISFMSQGFT